MLYMIILETLNPNSTNNISNDEQEPALIRKP